MDRLDQFGLLGCRVGRQRVAGSQAVPASVQAAPDFECQSCHRDQPLAGALRTDTADLEEAARNALQALHNLGYQGLSLDFSVRGLCADCAKPAPGALA